jgi:hypothetical protein
MNTGFQSLFDGCLDIDPSQSIPDLLKALPAGKGILLFCDSSDRPIQILSSASMRAAAIARLAPQPRLTPTKRADLSAVIARIHYLPTFCDFRSVLRYREIAMTIYPGEYRKMMNLSRLSLVHVDLADLWPEFSITQRASLLPSNRIFGPFPTRKSAAAFAQALNHAFMLCRNPSLAMDPEKARSCPYLQMNACPAPCVGLTPREEYFERVKLAVRAASGEHHELARAFREKMISLAAEQLFEAANQAKLSLAALVPLAEQTYRWTCDITKLAILHIDRSKRVKTPSSKKFEQSYAAFVIRPGCIDELPDLVPNDLPAVLTRITETLAAQAQRAEPLLTDSISMLESLLYRSTPPGIFVDLSKPSTAEQITSLLAGRFSRPESIRNAAE